MHQFVINQSIDTDKRIDRALVRRMIELVRVCVCVRSHVGRNDEQTRKNRIYGNGLVILIPGDTPMGVWTQSITLLFII